MKHPISRRHLAVVLSLLLCCTILLAQQPTQRGQQSPPQGMGTVSTGESRTYASKRTVGIVDPKAPAVFEDVTMKTALASFRHRAGTQSKDYIIDTPSGGVAVLDYDNDGRPDIYLLNGSTFGALRGTEPAPRAALYHNLGDWKFEDVTDKAGVANERWGMGVAVGDYDNDGYPDIFVGNFGTSRLYHNNGDGTFTDVAEKLGVARKGWSTGATFGDYDRDGRLDLFVPGYVDFDINHLPASPRDAASSLCQFRGVNVMCGPRGLKGEGDTLYHQKADGTFEDVSVKAGVSDPQGYYGFSSAFVHADDDDLLDLIVINDSTPNQLYINKGDGTFREVGYESGVALNENGREQAGMGLAVGDYDNDGRVDFYVTNFSDDSNTLRHNDGGGNFTDVTTQTGHGEPTIPFLGWGTAFLDFDNDGWQDLLVANGHVYPAVDRYQWGTSWAQQPLLFRNVANERGAKKNANDRVFERVGASPGSALALAYPARGLAIADFDGDGRLDAVMNNCDAPPALLRNVTVTRNHWLGLRLVGDPARKSPRDATGAIVYLTAGGTRRRLDVVSGGSFGSQNDERLHFGLGAATRVDGLEIRWPGGSTQQIAVSTIDRVLTIKEGKETK
jgi:hypothetical protein